MIDLFSKLRRRRAALVAAYDLSMWVVAFVLCALIRYDGVAQPSWSLLLVTALGAGAVYVFVARGFLVHQGRAKVASLDEFVLIGTAAATTGVIVTLANLLPILVARSVPMGATVFFMVLATSGRAVWRVLKEKDEKSLQVEGGRRVLLIGAGEAAQELVRSMVRDPQHEWRPVGMLDDDPHKRRLRVRGVPVLGATEELADAVARYDASTVVIAIPSASADVIARLRLAAVAAGAEVKVLPATSQLLTDHVGIRDIRDINLTDVLGRNQLDTDIGAIAGYLTGRRVLVTGAGGSIGSELCRQISRFDPAELMMLDRDESALHAVQLSIHGRALLDSNEVILNDIRDLTALRAIFERRRPEVVFHAAALKHLPMLEQYPDEAVKSNVVGTFNVLEAARSTGVERFVNISTDKAANPASVLGYSKRVAERLTTTFAELADGTYLSVRFGNVLGSRGSVLTSFAKQIAAGGPVTVTDPDVTRYFMTIEEACQLVVQAGAIGRDGEALVLDMGAPIRIVDVARQLIRQSGQQVDIEFTGLRPGEKLHEELFADDEPQDVRPSHPLVSHVPVPRLEVDTALALPRAGEPLDITRALAGLCLQGDIVPEVVG
ncbi:polysaccharide biosynthesis protein [Nocardioides piscis]|uniref:Polysaccharide biosynthesis protein n=1 Tax=Nocardioides piscis TaxID=2714938 RepID=A0A6G7YEC1_9ACTN|nr:nucleoside-diphosphate sugar epimerase/dehydratase [Nocardioides piscis]QIK75254.1 polysaccharide biosynthesis protein [Nocardioides piscis]